jgi:hypothetical protein
MNVKKIIVGTLSLALLLTGVACDTSRQQRQAGRNAAAEQKAVGDSFSRMSNSQPPPSFDWSQVRQTLIDVEAAQATGATSTSAFYLEGIGLIEWCPSIGSPVASTAQLSASKQWVDLPDDHTRERKEVDQGEPTGVYVGPSSGTWTICLDDNGKKFAHYWEGYVSSDIGIRPYPAEKRVQITGSTFNFTNKK